MPERVLQILAFFNMTQGELGACIGMHNSQVSSWVKGRSAMPQATAMAFQAALGVRWQWLLHGEGQMFLDDMGKLSADEVRLIKVYRLSDIAARKEILDQAEFQLGRSKRRGDTK